ncbi:Mobile element protein [uncultured Gammaproteobacteria bacterium]|nr:Mobile element protein [uncultured Gammaproteobacteria bacterium]
MAQYLLQSLSAVKQWVRHYKDEGIDGLKEKQRSGRPSKARNQNHTKLLQSILAMQNNKNGGRVRLKDIQNMLAKDFNIHYQNINGVHYLLTKLGLSWISADLNIQNKTKKRKRYIKNFKQKAIDVLPTDTDLNKVDVWFQDETRIGQQGSITRIWAEKGTRPRAVRQQQFEYGYIFGA